MNKNLPQNSKELYKLLCERAKTKALFADFNTHTISYADLHREVLVVTGFFRTRDLHIGDRVVILSDDDTKAIILFIAALLDGLVPIMLATDTREKRAQAIISKVSPQLIVADTDVVSSWTWLDTYKLTFLSADNEKKKIQNLFGLKKKKSKFFSMPFIDSAPQDPRCCADEQDTAYIIFTSGTTSLPKGVVTSHRNLFSHLSTITQTYTYDSQCKIFNNLALAHVDGLIQGPMLALYSGAELYRPESFTIQNLENLINRIFSKKITHLITVPTILSLMDRLLTETDYFEDDGFKVIVSVAGKLDAQLWRRFQKRFNVRICNIYGLSETVTGGIFCGPSDETFKMGTIGKPTDIEAKIVSDNGTACPDNTEGELFLKGDNVFAGYLKSAEETEKIFTGKWLHTGDIAIRDDHGFYKIVGRKKAVIISGGFNIHPDEITEVLTQQSQVEDAATTGIFDQDWGEIAVSAVVSPSGFDEQLLISFCRANLENYKVPKRIIQVDQLPRGMSGKVQIPELRVMIQNAINDEVKEQEGVALSDVIELAAKVFKVSSNSLSKDSIHQETPGWDSLGHLNLITVTEQQFGIQFTVNEMMEADSIKKMHQLIIKKISDEQ